MLYFKRGTFAQGNLVVVNKVLVLSTVVNIDMKLIRNVYFLLHQIFSKYGRVEDVYLMRDEKKQSRGMFPTYM